MIRHLLCADVLRDISIRVFLPSGLGVYQILFLIALNQYRRLQCLLWSLKLILHILKIRLKAGSEKVLDLGSLFHTRMILETGVAICVTKGDLSLILFHRLYLQLKISLLIHECHDPIM